MVTNTGSANLEKERWRLKLNEQEWTVNDMRLINEIAYQERLAKIPMEERTFRKAVEVAEDMPTIDAVPVVRCAVC